MFEEETKKRKKPRQPSEILDTPRRYLIRSGTVNSVLETETKPASSALMGTHEDQKHAEKRLGW